MVPARPIPAERIAPPGPWFRPSASNAKLGKMLVRSAPARPVPYPARPAWLVGGVTQLSQRLGQRRIVPRAGGGAGNNGGNGLKPERDEVMARRRPAAGAAWKTRGVPPRQLAMAAPRRVFAASGPKGGASFSLPGSFLPKAQPARAAALDSKKGADRPCAGNAERIRDGLSP